MPEFPREIEIERIMNLVRNFGWEKVTETQEGEYLTLTIRKKYVPESPERTEAPPS